MVVSRRVTARDHEGMATIGLGLRLVGVYSVRTSAASAGQSGRPRTNPDRPGCYAGLESGSSLESICKAPGLERCASEMRRVTASFHWRKSERLTSLKTCI